MDVRQRYVRTFTSPPCAANQPTSQRRLMHKPAGLRVRARLPPCFPPPPGQCCSAGTHDGSLFRIREILIRKLAVMRNYRTREPMNTLFGIPSSVRRQRRRPLRARLAPTFRSHTHTHTPVPTYTHTPTHTHTSPERRWRANWRSAVVHTTGTTLAYTKRLGSHLTSRLARRSARNSGRLRLEQFGAQRRRGCPSSIGELAYKLMFISP